MEEAARAGTILKSAGAVKLNIGALGNLVPQLHLHVIARQPGDPAWPGPVWGHSSRRSPYEAAARAARHRAGNALVNHKRAIFGALAGNTSLRTLVPPATEMSCRLEPPDTSAVVAALKMPRTRQARIFIICWERRCANPVSSRVRNPPPHRPPACSSSSIRPGWAWSRITRRQIRP